MMKIIRGFIKKIIIEVCLEFGANIFMNGDWADCNRCGAIINLKVAKCMKAAEKGEPCFDFGMVCLHCYKDLLIECNK